MKISRKILISNLIIGGIATILLSLMTIYVINDFIRDNVYANLENEVNLISELSKEGDFKSVSGDKDGFSGFPKRQLDTKNISKFRTLTTRKFFVLDEDGSLINDIDAKYDDSIYDEFFREIHESQEGKLTKLLMEDKSVVTYKKVVEVELDGEIKIVQYIGLVYNNDVSELFVDMIIPVLVVLSLILILSFVVSGLLGNSFTKPVSALITMTNKIAQKESVNSEINSGDEFQLIGEALQEMSEEISSKDLQSKQFYEHVSHDLKTPLTIISGYAEGVNSGIFEDNEEPLNKIVKQCDSLKNQIENLIYLSQLESKKKVFEYEEVVLESMINKVLDDFEAVFITKDIEVEYQPKSETKVKVDKDKIIRSFNNILSNSIKWTANEIKVSIHETETTIQVVFEDNGPGFSEEVLNDPSSGYKDSEDNGNGIGLMIVHRIMDAHNIGVELMNTDYGSRVVFSIDK